MYKRAWTIMYKSGVDYVLEISNTIHATFVDHSRAGARGQGQGARGQGPGARGERPGPETKTPGATARERARARERTRACGQSGRTERGR